MEKLKKVLRFMIIYGPLRTYVKVAGRVRSGVFKYVKKKSFQKDIAVIGCGQFAFSAIAFFLVNRFGSRIAACFDINRENADSLSRFFRIEKNALDYQDLLDDTTIKYIYIASNHASHAGYAVDALAKGKTVYVEKPVSVTYSQFRKLVDRVRHSNKKIYAGYNRPFSKAVRTLCPKFKDKCEPITMSCFITGHLIPEDHWYRNPSEGTRVCGNLGHWLDLAVHILSWNRLADRWQITIAYSNIEIPDDNISISLTSEAGDLVTITLSSHCEPFEGVYETINITKGDVIAKIDDFRKMTLWEKTRKKKYTYWPKDVGHKRSILQPFSESKRDWHEIELSTLLMLFIKEMVLRQDRSSVFSFSEQWETLTDRLKAGETGLTFREH